MSKIKFTLNSLALGLMIVSVNAYATCTPNVTNTSNSSIGLLASSANDCVENSGNIQINIDYMSGIHSELAANYSTITNAGSITTTGLYSYGIYSENLNAAITNLNSGSITTSGDNSYGIHSEAGYSTISNAGSITTSGDNSYGISSMRANNDLNATNATIINSGNITTSGNSSYGIWSTGVNATIKNSGNITTSGNSSYGISSHSGAATVTSSGTINTSGYSSNAIYSSGNSTTNTNSGTINTSGASGVAIYSTGNSTTNTNSGDINTTGEDAYGINTIGTNSNIANSGTISSTGSYAIGIRSNGDNSIITNNGIIATSGYGGWGVMTGGLNSTITNNRIITTSGYGAAGLKIYGDNSIITNNGRITTFGNTADGILSVGNNIIINNSGSIRIADGNSAAITIGNAGFYGANNNTVNLLKGSIIVGDIHADTGLTGAKLNINLGSGTSYAYSVTGPWTVTDLDNRPMVTGSAFAAGIGAQETAAQMLYQRTSSVTSALDRRLRSYSSEEVDNQPYWLDVYYSDVSRNSGGNYSTRNAFSNYNYGMTAGFKLPVEITPMELVVNVEQSNLNIDSGNQKIDSTSIMAGVVAPDLTDVFGAKFSAKALVGFANNDGDRKVMTNSLLYDGSRQIKSDYNSTYAVFGAALTKLYPITDHLTADTLVGLDLVTEHINAYAETDYFAWQGRTLNQFQSRVQAGLDYKLFENKVDLFARVGVERRDLISGDTQNYSINDAGTITNVSFKSTNSNDTYATAQLGFKAQLEKRIQLFGVVNGLHSSDTVSSIQGNIGLRADF